MVTHQLDCAVVASAASASSSPAVVAAISLSCSSCGWPASVFPDHHVFREGEMRPGVDRRWRGEAERLHRHPARQCEHFGDALGKRRFESGSVDTTNRLGEIKHDVAVGPRRLVVGPVSSACNALATCRRHIWCCTKGGARISPVVKMLTIWRTQPRLWSRLADASIGRGTWVKPRLP
jgi:hypothetical protein